MVLPYLTDPLVHVPLRLGSYSDHQGQQRDKASYPKSETLPLTCLVNKWMGLPKKVNSKQLRNASYISVTDIYSLVILN